MPFSIQIGYLFPSIWVAFWILFVIVWAILIFPRPRWSGEKTKLSLAVAFALFPFAYLLLNVVFLLLQPMYVKATWRYLWLENGFNARATNLIPIETIQSVYVRYSPSGFRRDSYWYIGVQATTERLSAGTVPSRANILRIRQDLTQFLEARGVKVSNDPLPAKP